MRRAPAILLLLSLLIIQAAHLDGWHFHLSAGGLPRLCQHDDHDAAEEAAHAAAKEYAAASRIANQLSAIRCPEQWLPAWAVTPPLDACRPFHQLHGLPEALPALDLPFIQSSILVGANAMRAPRSTARPIRAIRGPPLCS